MASRDIAELTPRMQAKINFNTPPTPTPKPKPAKDGWGKWYNTTHKTKTFAEQHEINSQETLQSIQTNHQKNYFLVMQHMA